MSFSYLLKLLKDKIEDLKKRKTCLDLASKCENELEKIYFIDNNFYTGYTSDAEDDTWDEMMYLFLDKFDLDDDNYQFVNEEIMSICFDKKRSWKVEDEVITKFKKIFPNLEYFKKDFKLMIFSFYFEDSAYKDETEMKQEDINKLIKKLKMDHPENEIPNLDDF